MSARFKLFDIGEIRAFIDNSAATIGESGDTGPDEVEIFITISDEFFRACDHVGGEGAGGESRISSEFFAA